MPPLSALQVGSADGVTCATVSILDAAAMPAAALEQAVALAYQVLAGALAQAGCPSCPFLELHPRHSRGDGQRGRRASARSLHGVQRRTLCRVRVHLRLARRVQPIASDSLRGRRARGPAGDSRARPRGAEAARSRIRVRCRPTAIRGATARCRRVSRARRSSRPLAKNGPGCSLAAPPASWVKTPSTCATRGVRRWRRSRTSRGWSTRRA